MCVCVCVQGQAQECLVEKSLKGIGRVKNLTIARLATRVCSAVSKCTIIVLHVYVIVLQGKACTLTCTKSRTQAVYLKQTGF